MKTKHTLTMIAIALTIAVGALFFLPETNHVQAKDSAFTELMSGTYATTQQSSTSTKKVIVGSWMETITFSGVPIPPLKSLVIFSSDGTVTVADQGNVNVAAGQLFSAGAGSWVAQGERTFAWTTVELISDLSGNLTGTLKVRGVYTVDESGNSYSGVFFAEVKDPAGNVLFSIDGTNAGQRIQVEAIP
jgi:hypothetical protein